jgi:hypothetical protein
LRLPRIRIRQWGCHVHGAFREYPPFLVRFKHYCSGIIDAALDARCKGQTVEAFCESWELPDPRTPTRWIAGFVQRLKSVGLKAERRLEGLGPLENPPTASHEVGSATENRWQYAYVWALLTRLQEICQTRIQPISRSHFIFTL